MKLSEWLEREKRDNGLTRYVFAERIGVSAATVTALCNSEAPWMSKDTAEAIVRETRGEVTPNDYIADQHWPDEARAAP